MLYLSGAPPRPECGTRGRVLNFLMIPKKWIALANSVGVEKWEWYISSDMGKQQ